MRNRHHQPKAKKRLKKSEPIFESVSLIYKAGNSGFFTAVILTPDEKKRKHIKEIEKKLNEKPKGKKQ